MFMGAVAHVLVHEVKKAAKGSHRFRVPVAGELEVGRRAVLDGQQCEARLVEGWDFQHGFSFPFSSSSTFTVIRSRLPSTAKSRASSLSARMRARPSPDTPRRGAVCSTSWS